MRRATLLVGLAVLAVLAGCGSGGGDDDARPALSAAQRRLLDELRAGGLVVTFRHATSDTSYDREAGDYADCSRQRNLTRAGREQARALGRELRALRIPVGPVLASPYCRARDTARLAFGRVRLTEDVLPSTGEPGDALDARVRRLLTTPPPAGRDTVLVGHNTTFQAVVGLQLPEGGAAVFRPARPGFRLVATVTPEQWRRLAGAA